MPTAGPRIERFLAKYSPGVRREAVAARRILRRRMPTALELVYDNYNALVFAFSANEKTTGVILSIALYPRWVTLFFMHGKKLSDPDGLLEGSGKQVRGIRLSGAKDLVKPAIRALIALAIAKGSVPLPVTGRGRTIVRSVSAKQRPRRPR